MNWWHRLLGRRKMDEQLEKELRFHLENHVNDLIAKGHEPREALRLARLDLGAPSKSKKSAGIHAVPVGSMDCYAIFGLPRANFALTRPLLLSVC